MTLAQVLSLAEEHERVMREAERATRYGPVERGTYNDLATMGGLG